MKNVFKKLMAFMLALVLSCSCLQADPVSAASYSDFYEGATLVVTAPDGVNMRKLPEVTSSDYITTLAYGSRLYVNQIEDGWMLVTCGTHTGWVEEDVEWFSTYTPSVYTYSQNMQAKVVASALNVHQTPVRLSSNILDDLYKGQVVDAVGYTTTGWVKVKYYRGTSLIEGYVSSAWVQVSVKTSTAAMEKFTTIYGYSAVVKSKNSLNVRCSPSTSADILTSISRGTVVNILAQSTNWYRISLNVGGNMRTGYIYRSYTNMVDALDNLYLSATSKTLKAKKKYHILLRGNTGMSLTYTWKTSNKKVATVSKYGIVTAKKSGTAKITCTVKVGSRTKKLTCKIKVK